MALLTIDERSARSIAAVVAETFDSDDVAVSVADSGGGDWQVAIHFAAAVNRAALRTLITTAAGPAAAKALRFERVATTDWVSQSLGSLRPVVAGRFIIHGSHDRHRVAVNCIGIEIEAALAFGTGHHGTTRGCLLALDHIGKAESRRNPLRRRVKRSRIAGGGRILDLGTGSGVLAIAAARALRRPVLATDIDPSAVRAARGNAQRNGAAPWITLVQANGVTGSSLGAAARFRLIFANILLRPLLRFATPLRARTTPNGRVVLSGLLSSQANAVLTAYRPLVLERRLDLEDWTTLVLARRTRPHGVAARRRRP